MGRIPPARKRRKGIFHFAPPAALPFGLARNTVSPVLKFHTQVSNPYWVRCFFARLIWETRFSESFPTSPITPSQIARTPYLGRIEKPLPCFGAAPFMPDI
jgi:hypothetical protein